jgi:hypothetical protein
VGGGGRLGRLLYGRGWVGSGRWCRLVRVYCSNRKVCVYEVVVRYLVCSRCFCLYLV